MLCSSEQIGWFVPLDLDRARGLDRAAVDRLIVSAEADLRIKGLISGCQVPRAVSEHPDAAAELCRFLILDKVRISIYRKVFPPELARRIDAVQRFSERRWNHFAAGSFRAAFKSPLQVDTVGSEGEVGKGVVGFLENEDEAGEIKKIAALTRGIAALYGAAFATKGGRIPIIRSSEMARLFGETVRVAVLGVYLRGRHWLTHGPGETAMSPSEDERVAADWLDDLVFGKLDAEIRAAT